VSIIRVFGGRKIWFLLLLSLTAYGAVKKQATPAKGDLSDQEIPINTPYCDAYLPYTFDPQLQVRPLLPGAANNPDTSDASLNAFLGKGYSISDSIGSDGGFADPGYPILGDPKRHLFSDGSDLTRLLMRLLPPTSGSSSPTPLCGKAPITTVAPQGDATSAYYLVNVVRWKASGGAYQIATSDWYIFNKSDGKAAHRQFPFTFHPYVSGDLRIFGSNKVVFLAVHLAPDPEASAPDATAAWTRGKKVEAGQFVLPTVPKGHYYVAQNSGTTSGKEPTWCLSSACIVKDGNVNWRESGDPPDNYVRFKSTVKISYKLHVERVEPANIQDLKALLNIVIPGAPFAGAAENTPLAQYKTFLFSAKDRQYAGSYGAAKLVNLQNLPVQITASTTAKLPGKSDQLQDAEMYSYAGFWDSLEAKKNTAQPPKPKPSNGGSGSNKGKQGSTGGATESSSDSNPSADSGANSPSASNPSTPSAPSSAIGSTTGPGCTTNATATGGSCSEALKIQNEGLYWWDVSVGVPFKTIKDLSFGNGQVTPQTVSKKTAYGFFSLAPWKEDYLSPPSLGIPHLLVGIPFSGKVFDSPFVGAGETLNLSKLPSVGSTLSKVIPIGIRFYAGLQENKVYGTSSGNTTPPHRWVGKLQYGIEFSVRDVANKLTGKSTSGSTTKTSKTSNTQDTSNAQANAGTPDGGTVRAADSGQLDFVPRQLDFVPGQLIVQFKKDATSQQVEEVQKMVGAVLKEKLSSKGFSASGVSGHEEAGGLQLLVFPESSSAATSPGFSASSAAKNASGEKTQGERVISAAKLIAKHPAVQFAEPNYLFHATETKTSNDPYYVDGKLWGLYGTAPPDPALSKSKSAFGIGVDAAWARSHTGSRNVYVGIIDTGIDINHPELQPNIFTNPSPEQNTQGQNAGGVVGDVHGWDFYGNTASVLPVDDQDSPHGTHVAGIIGAVGGNGAGVVGVNWEVTMIPVRFLDPNEEGSALSAVKAFDYLTNLKTKYNLRIVAINASWTGYEYSAALLAAVKRAANAGILVIAAAGNEGYKNKKSYPANFDMNDTSDGTPKAAFNPLISVGAIDSSGALASFSNSGSTTVDLAAPGVEIWSTAPRCGYLQKDGTSMATPLVTGAAALYASTHDSADGTEIRNAIFNHVLPTDSLRVTTRTGGRLDLSTF
jgi:subtilisin family serine protease